MTAYQTQHYWRNWAAAVRAQGWGTVVSIAAAQLSRQQGTVSVSPDLDAILAKIWQFADELAAKTDGRVTANTLRHACHIVAADKSVSSKRFSNAAFGCVLAPFRLLADSNQVANVMAWQNRAEAGDRQRHVYFGHSDLTRLTLAELRQLSLTIRARWQSRAKRECETVQAVPA